MNLKHTAVYIHIPFCEHKCIYCDFYSIITHDNIDNYLQSLKKEISHYAKKHSEGRIIDTIFFGGGTPSLMKPKYIKEIIESVNKNFTVNPDAEITLETNPGTVTKNKFGEYKRYGINRISIGVQSFNDKELKFLTRIHNKKEAIKTVEDAYAVGFENISIDLIFSLPEQTKKTWMQNLQTAVGLPVKHISAYSLILEKGTILNKMVIEGKIKMTAENSDAELYKLTMDFLSGENFKQYEVSNFAKENYECRHNLYYWSYCDYFGFGTAAHSFLNGKRRWNFSSLKKYISEIKNNGNAVRGSEALSSEEMLEELIMLGLRSKGINLNKVKIYDGNWYFDKQKKIEKLVSKKYITINNGFIQSTQKGYMICDELISELI